MPLSETLQHALKPYAIGEKLRALRLRRKMALVELAKHTGMSAGMLSKIERGRLIPTVPTLARIALVFSVGLDHFFTSRQAPTIAVVRKGERKRFPARQGDRSPEYFFESLDYPALDRVINSYYAEFEPVSNRRERFHSHPGAEFIYVIGGKAVITVKDAEYRLDAGDAMYFDSTMPHAYHREGALRCSAIVVTTDSSAARDHGPQKP